MTDGAVPSQEFINATQTFPAPAESNARTYLPLAKAFKYC